MPTKKERSKSEARENAQKCAQKKHELRANSEKWNEKQHKKIVANSGIFVYIAGQRAREKPRKAEQKRMHILRI